MNKDNKIILFAVIILLIAMFSYNSFDEPFFEKASGKIDITGKAATNLTFEKCSIRQAKWSSTPDKLTPITSVKNGQAVYVYMETVNCEGEEITFELYRVKKRFILKDILVSEGTITKIVPRSGVLAGNFIVYVNSEDGTSSVYKFRVRLSKYLQPANQTTNTTNMTGLPDLIVESTTFREPWTLQIFTSVSSGTLVSPIVTFKNIGESRSSGFLTSGKLTKDGLFFRDIPSSLGWLDPGQSVNVQTSIFNTSTGKYCFEEVKADSDNAVLESNENNNGINTQCLIVTSNQTTNQTLPPDNTSNYTGLIIRANITDLATGNLVMVGSCSTFEVTDTCSLYPNLISGRTYKIESTRNKGDYHVVTLTDSANKIIQTIICSSSYCSFNVNNLPPSNYYSLSLGTKIYNQTNTTTPPTTNTTNMTRLPDLIVESVDWVTEGPNWQCCGETIVITSANVGDKIMGKLTIKNTGTGNVTVGNLFDVKAIATKDGVKLTSPSGELRWTVGSLFVGQSKNSIPLTLNVTETGRYCLENTKVDYFNTVIELREDNNLFASKCINVGSN